MIRFHCDLTEREEIGHTFFTVTPWLHVQRAARCHILTVAKQRTAIAAILAISRAFLMCFTFRGGGCFYVVFFNKMYGKICEPVIVLQDEQRLLYFGGVCEWRKFCSCRIQGLVGNQIRWRMFAKCHWQRNHCSNTGLYVK